MGSARIVAWLTGLALLASPGPSLAMGAAWNDDLDRAYSITWQSPAELRSHLARRADALGVSLREMASVPVEGARIPPDEARRLAVAHLLLYLAEDDAAELDASVALLEPLRAHLGRFENRYWYHYVLAHQALAERRPIAFSEQVMALWLRVVVPLEGPHADLERLSIQGSASAGFVAALPAVYENLAELIVSRTHERGVDRDLDGLAAIVRLLAHERATALAQPVKEVVAWLDGPASDDGSLSFVLALRDARARHARLREHVAHDGWGERTHGELQRVAAAYERALTLAETTSGRCAVHTDTLRLRTDVYASREDVAGEPPLEVPGSPQRAMQIHAEMRAAQSAGWPALGFHSSSHDAYLRTMEALWREIQAALLAQADFQLWRAQSGGPDAGRDARRAAATYGSLLEFFDGHAPARGSEGVPESAYFAAFRAAHGIARAFLEVTPDPTSSEIDHGIAHGQRALRLMPFDRVMWTWFATALGRHGREGAFADLVRPVGERVQRSSSVDAWIAAGEPEAERIAALRSALSDGFVTTYMGFAEAGNLEQLEADLEALRGQRAAVAARADALVQQRDAITASTWSPAAPAAGEPRAAAPEAGDALDLKSVAADLDTAQRRLARIDAQLLARSRALPLYRRTLETDDLRLELQREDHPLHRLLRRMFQEDRS